MTVAFAFDPVLQKNIPIRGTIPVTDENGETVTNEQGKVVTEVSTERGKTVMLLQLFLLQKTNASQKASSTKEK